VPHSALSNSSDRTHVTWTRRVSPSHVRWTRGSRAQHWPAAWVGLDAMEALGLVATGVLVRRRDARRCLAAAATATLLLADAWFDVTTAASGADHLVALLLAVFAEVSIAALCAVLAVRTVPGRASW
jgi:hypothetical protein